jgi:ATP/maltotriose-dependent transcriptional regulator MalT
VLELTDLCANSAIVPWIVPSVAYALIETDPEKAVELMAWIFSYPDPALTWAREWPLLGRLQAHLQDILDRDTYRTHWEHGQALTFDGLTTYIQLEFGASPDAAAEVSQPHLLTSREREILGLIGTGMTNPQIAARLIIGAGTVKTHTLNIYRKLKVANRTQAIVRAQELGLLRA